MCGVCVSQILLFSSMYCSCSFVNNNHDDVDITDFFIFKSFPIVLKLAVEGVLVDIFRTVGAKSGLKVQSKE